MAHQVVKKENIVISIGEYQKQGKTKQKYRTIGELITMRDENGEEYQFGETWGPNGSMPFNVYSQDDNNKETQPQAVSQKPVYVPPAQIRVGYQLVDGSAIMPEHVQRYQKAGIQPWPIGKQPPPLPQ